MTARGAPPAAPSARGSFLTFREWLPALGSTPKTLTRSVALVGLAACALAAPAGARRHDKEPKVSVYAPTPPPLPAPPAADGAIFHAASGYAPLTSGSRAAIVGDILTILLVESTQAQKSSTSNTDHSSALGVIPPTTGPLSFFKASDATASGTAKFDGKGAATQSNQLSGELSVTVAEVYPNGTMLVRGEKVLTLNRGDEHIQIQGLVRSADIGPDNRVPSTRVADARIFYTGKGDVARAARPGWLTHFFSFVNPF